MVVREDFDPSIGLPPGLEIGQIRRAVEYVEREASGLVDIYGTGLRAGKPVPENGA